MFRRYVTCLLLVSYLITGLAGGTHAHASPWEELHSRPHLHCDWFIELITFHAAPAAQGGPHDHPHTGHGHAHDRGCDDACNAPACVECPHDHDSTCVYLADQTHVVSAAAAPARQDIVHPPVATVDMYAQDLVWVTILRPQWAHPPPESLVGGYDLILKLRTLRI